MQGFKLFETYLRGREELILRVYSERKTPQHRNLATKANSLDVAKSLLLLNSGDGVPPASPCDRELEKDSSKTAFLIAAYARYGRPFVWLRSHHKRLVQLEADDSEIDADMPLKLNSTHAWLDGQDIRIIDIVSEVISLVLQPPPGNPFAVDHDFFDTLPVQESVLATGALIQFLKGIYMMNRPYSQDVFEDLQLLNARHWKDVMSI
ncbi:hypothetical protein HDU76_001093 [Blyttiomyces sp. JEL0837]|nr:hypothetical protein HDU76_001093 [Blyttiomyces sp. JEL0837]